MHDVETVYSIPILLNKQKADQIILKKLNINSKNPNLLDWKGVVRAKLQPKGETNIAFVGKYTELKDSYKSINEALEHAGIKNKAQVNINFVEAENITSKNISKTLKNAESELEIQSDIYKQELDEIRSQINEIRGRLAENNVKQRYQSLVAPIQGVVFDIQPKIVGYTAQATETILKIVPESELEARIEIPSDDIGFVKDGMSVDISIDSYPSTDFGVISGSINNISSDALEPDQSAQRSVFSYPAKITLDSQVLKLDNGNELKLKAGMSLNASIKLRKVSYLQLLLSSFKNKTDSLKEL